MFLEDPQGFFNQNEIFETPEIPASQPNMLGEEVDVYKLRTQMFLLLDASKDLSPQWNALMNLYDQVASQFIEIARIKPNSALEDMAANSSDLSSMIDHDLVVAFQDILKFYDKLGKALTLVFTSFCGEGLKALIQLEHVVRIKSLLHHLSTAKELASRIMPEHIDNAERQSAITIVMRQISRQQKSAITEIEACCLITSNYVSNLSTHHSLEAKFISLMAALRVNLCGFTESLYAQYFGVVNGNELCLMRDIQGLNRMLSLLEKTLRAVKFAFEVEPLLKSIVTNYSEEKS